MVNYELLAEQLDALTNGVPHLISNLANASSLLWYTLPDLNWAGFYLVENDVLVLGPFHGKTACIEIPIYRGVCGTAFSRDETIVVPDVHCFTGHIACDSASASEIVIPLHKDGAVVAVMDLDSPMPNRFTREDREGLERFAQVLEKNVF